MVVSVKGPNQGEWWHPFADATLGPEDVQPLSSEQKGFTVTIFSASDYCGYYDAVRFFSNA